MATRVTDQIWFSVMLAWLIKVVVLKYGGVALYRRTRPFFMGMIVGHIVPGGIFLLQLLITRGGLRNALPTC